MKTKIQKVCMVLLFLLMAGVLQTPLVTCAKEISCTASIPVEVAVSGNAAPSGEQSELVIEPIENGNPMPEQTKAVITDSGKAVFGPITYTVPEDYQYRIYQTPGTTKNFTYDKAEYIVTVRVVNAENDGLTAEVWAVKNGAGSKTDKICFTNVYKAPDKPNVKTGDNASVGVYIMLAFGALILIAVLKARGKRLE